MQIQTNVHEHIFTEFIIMEMIIMSRFMNSSSKNRKRVTEMSEREYIAYKKRREASLNTRNIIIRFVFITAVAMILTISIKAITTFASSSAGAEQKYYKTVSIGYNDTLESIAESNYDPSHYSTAKDYLQEIMDINHLSADSAIGGGQIIYIPYYSEIH